MKLYARYVVRQSRIAAVETNLKTNSACQTENESWPKWSHDDDDTSKNMKKCNELSTG